MTISFKRTYEQERGPAVPDFQSYANRITGEFAVLLARDPDERAVQTFLEQNPCMVPGAWTPGSISGHSPLNHALISQPPLHGFNARIPDFMWLSRHSSSWFPAMIEIERPGKKLFTSAEIPSAEFNQAKNQFVQWRTWLSEPGNMILLMDHYGISQRMRDYCSRELHFLLIYGRRAEFDGKPNLSKQRGKLLSMPEELMSFDRLAPDRKLRKAVTVKAKGNGRFEVVAVAETFALSPRNADDLLALDGLSDAIHANRHISPERAAFLERRIPYWAQWAAREQRGIVGGDGDFDE